jgi:hypothetical protein
MPLCFTELKGKGSANCKVAETKRSPTMRMAKQHHHEISFFLSTFRRTAEIMAKGNATATNKSTALMPMMCLLLL